MLYDVKKVADLTGVSTVTIYRKLKLKELESFIIEKQGKSYIDEEGLHVISELLHVNSDENADVKNKNFQDEVTVDTTAFNEVLSVKDEVITSLKEQLSLIKDQLVIKDQQLSKKDEQLSSKDKLLENMQVLLKQEQDKEKQKEVLQLEAHFKELDFKLAEIREEMQQRKNKKKIFSFFKKE